MRRGHPGPRPAIQGARHHNWKGGVVRSSDGYIQIYKPDHPRAGIRNRKVFEHILIAEKAVGHVLPPKVVVHHVDEIKSHNQNANLVVCENDVYHRLLHRRMRVLQRGGEPNTQKICKDCDKVLPFTAFYKSARDGPTAMCKTCHSLRSRRRA